MTGRPFTRLLVANRGEIAVRIIRACRELGIETVAVYSAADAGGLHVKLADIAVPIGDAEPRASYLNGEAIVRAAVESGAGAVHPGYGFLSENAAFAAAVEAAGLMWVGPPARAIAAMGDKVEAKRLAAEAGVPVVPGYAGDDATDERLAEEAQRVGYPVMLKAAAGGGGRGMRAVTRPEDFADAVASARREAKSAFGDDRMFLEKLIVRPRHVEVQIIADSSGHAVYLGERDCSIQRRHQKVVEEAPSPAVSPEIRAAMGEAAVRLAQACGYISAGTVEFLLDGSMFYFLEMNTRIQVEHPVTELVTGLDLVQLQLKIASGEPLPISQDAVTLEGHAIEARIYAEDPEKGFLPSTGVLRRFDPPNAATIRNDVGVYPGATVSHFYDPMLAKLIVHGTNREEAVEELDFALRDYVVTGVTTNIPFLRWLVSQPAFRRGEFDITYLDRTWTSLDRESVPAEVLVLATLGQTSTAIRPLSAAGEPWRSNWGWRPAGTPRTFRYRAGAQEIEVRARPRGDEWTIWINDAEHHVRVRQVAYGDVLLELEGALISGNVFADPRGLDVEWNGGAYRLDFALPEASAAARGRSERSLTSPMPGTVVNVRVEPGQRVAAHEPLLVLEAMKIEHVVEAPHAGTVDAVLFGVGDLVPAGAEVVRLEPLA